MSEIQSGFLKPNDGKSTFVSLLYSIFSFSTVRLARIHSIKIGIIFRLLQVGIVGYIIGWSIVYKKGYQQFDTVSSTVTTKVKGLGYINYTNGTLLPIKYDQFALNNDPNPFKLFDTADYTIPPNEYNSIFIMTNFIDTKQTQGKCEEDFTNTKISALCNNDIDCKQLNLSTNNWNGIPTGNCIQSLYNSSLKVCEIFSWCPVERNEESSDEKRNLSPNVTDDFISKCAYVSNRDPYCPTFTLKQIIEQAEPDPTERELMLKKGGVIQIGIDWQCNYDLRNPCSLNYKFNRFDVRFNESKATSGFNFRFADKFEINGTMYRDLLKAFGLRIIIQVTGKAGKFDFVPLLLTVGAGLGLLSVATIVADFILLYVTGKRNFYKQLKELDYKKDVELKDLPEFRKYSASFSAKNPNYEE